MAAVRAMEKPATYWHMLPEYSQARKSVWDAVNPHTGKRRIDEAFPVELRKKTKDREMFIEFRNGSTWQLVGSDSYNSLVGSPPFGVTASEWALANPAAWAYLRPILAENGGWAAFISTVRGRNHFFRMHEAYKDDPDWFVQVLKATDTDALSKEMLERERIEYQKEYGVEDGDALFAQEYMCSFDAAIVGSYYGRVMRDAEDDGRITSVPYDPAHLVYTAWDLGMSDSTAIWMFQVIGNRINIIDTIQNSGQQTSWYVSELQKRRYSWGADFLPHDGAHINQQTGLSTIDFVRKMGRNANQVDNSGNKQFVSEGIKAARSLIPRCYFDREKCKEGIDALVSYHRKYDRERKVFHDRPEHDWSSHFADAFRYLALSLTQVESSAGGAAIASDFANRRRY